MISYLPNNALVRSEPVLHRPGIPQDWLVADTLPDEPLLWIDECCRTDEACNQAISPKETPHFLPTRLIDIGAVSSSTLHPRLIETKRLVAERPRYVALSHRWGDSHKDPQLELMTTVANMEVHMREINVAKLSKTFQFVIDVCRWLGIRYLWIDSFCIVQDSKSDWKAESDAMAKIYRHSYCTISINIPEVGGKSLWTHCGYVGETAEGWVIDALDHDTWKTTSKNFWVALMAGGMLGQRAWCLQERELSPRILHFLDPGMVMFECCHFAAAIGGPVVFGTRYSYSRECKDEDGKRLIDVELGKGPEYHASLCKHTKEAWYRVLVSYTERLLTQETDRPLAIRGVVDHIATTVGYTYCHGIWQEDAARGLLWERNASVEERWCRSQHSGWEAPSWSWLSIRGPVKGAIENDEDSQPHIFEDTRHYRPIHRSFGDTKTSISFSSDERIVHIEGDVLQARLDYDFSNEDWRTLGRGVPVQSDGFLFRRTVGMACLDDPSQSFHGQITIVRLADFYGMLLVEAEDPGKGLLYKRLGVVREPTTAFSLKWDQTSFDRGTCSVV
ncbi:heterokaryon incompatibility protein-domain-containing protein [Stachybotrys elegans]|uniref:Heterokaryon incompatibility protein-domain-containing protein n=1 Tax=Stachybotrys elegans TaxID=80388 RepID=A0A8K0SNU6_9HYPO|nr:heterokaryon incompatibility protein-domain-containing protein [Stachybotrys elegans]